MRRARKCSCLHTPILRIIFPAPKPQVCRFSSRTEREIILTRRIGNPKRLGMGKFKRLLARTIQNIVRAPHMKTWWFEALLWLPHWTFPRWISLMETDFTYRETAKSWLKVWLEAQDYPLTQNLYNQNSSRTKISVAKV